MKQKICMSILMFSLLILPLAGAGVKPAYAAPEAQVTEDSLISVWVFEDADLNGVYSTGDDGFTDAWVKVRNKTTKVDLFGGTDEGDVEWDITAAGKFYTQVDSSSVPAGYKLRSIRCVHTRTYETYEACQYHLRTWKTDFKLPYGTRIYIYYAVVPE